MLYTIQQAAKELHCSVSTVRRMVKAKVLDTVDLSLGQQRKTLKIKGESIQAAKEVGFSPAREEGEPWSEKHYHDRKQRMRDYKNSKAGA